jgi:hypothetical protein
MTGANVMAVTRTPKENVKNLTKRCVVVVWGGTKYVVKNKATNGMSQLNDCG